MRSFAAFFAGISSVLSFGWAKNERCSNITAKTVASDWSRISNDIDTAIRKYKMEKNNDKA